MKRTTVRLHDDLVERARKEAARRGKTLTALIDEGLRQVLAHSNAPVSRKRVRLPVSASQGGTLPGVDLNDAASLLDRMEGRK